MASLYDTAQVNRGGAQALRSRALDVRTWRASLVMVLVCYPGGNGCTPFARLAIDATSRRALKRVRARLAEYYVDKECAEALRILDKSINPTHTRNSEFFGWYAINDKRVIHCFEDSSFDFGDAKETTKAVFSLICQAAFESGVAPVLAGDSLGFDAKELLGIMNRVQMFALMNVRNNELESKLEGWNRESEV